MFALVVSLHRGGKGGTLGCRETVALLGALSLGVRFLLVSEKEGTGVIHSHLFSLAQNEFDEPKDSSLGGSPSPAPPGYVVSSLGPGSRLGGRDRDRVGLCFQVVQMFWRVVLFDLIFWRISF